MLINCKLFSHDRFVCTLISRGETFRNNMNDIKKPSNLLTRLRDQSTGQNKGGLPGSQNFHNLLQKRQSIDCKLTGI